MKDGVQRLTAERLVIANGKPYPCLMGMSATRYLMYLAARPGSRPIDLARYFGVGNQSVSETLRFLRQTGIVRGHVRWRINQRLKRSRELVELLKALAEHFGIESSTEFQNSFGRLFKDDTPECDLPADLFWRRERTTLLMFAASLGEFFAREAVACMRSSQDRLSLSLRLLEAEGVLISRQVAQMRLYRLNPEYPAASKLETLLRRMVRDRPELVQATNAILLIRKRRHFHASNAVAPFYSDELERHGPSKSVAGTWREVIGGLDGRGAFPPKRYSGPGGPCPSEKLRKKRRRTTSN